MNDRTHPQAVAEQQAREAAPSCTCDHAHTPETAVQDWHDGALGFRNTEGYRLHKQPCPYSDEIVKRYATHADLHAAAVRRYEEE